MVHSCHSDWFYVTNHLPDNCCIMIEVNQCPSHMVAGLHTRCDITNSNDCIYNQTFLFIVHHCRILRFTDWGCCWAFFTKVLFYFLFYSNLFYHLCIFKYHHYHTTNTSWAEFHINCFCQKSFQNKQLFLFISAITMFFNKCKLLSSDKTIDWVMLFHSICKFFTQR